MVVVEAEDVEDALLVVPELAPDVVVVRVSVPELVPLTVPEVVVVVAPETDEVAIKRRDMKRNKMVQINEYPPRN